MGQVTFSKVSKVGCILIICDGTTYRSHQIS